MKGNYLVVDKKVLPDVYEKVLEVKNILKEGKIREITEATKVVGISRSVYYKYKDHVFEFSKSIQGRKMTFNMIINHKKGVLSDVLNYISDKGGNVLTINQSIPINDSANLSITIDMSTLECGISTLLDGLEEMPNTLKVSFIAME